MADPAVVTHRAKAGSGKKHKITIPPPRLTFREVSKPTDEAGDPIVNKWIYLFIQGSAELYAEIYAEKEDRWHVEYRPHGRKSLKGFDRRTKGDVKISRKRLDGAEYRVFLSPVRASDDALERLKKETSKLKTVVPEGTNAAGVPFVHVADWFHSAEFQHSQYLYYYKQWESFVSDRQRQAGLFIASAVKNWLADGDPADIGKHLKDKAEPARIVTDYKKGEQSAREEAEQAMVALCKQLDMVEHRAIDLSTQKGGEEELAVGLLHWGIVSHNMCSVAPGRVFAKKLMEEEEALPATILMGEAEHPDLYGAYATFKKVYAASASTVLQLLAAKVRHLRKSVSPRGSTEKIILYLRKLGIETELKGNYKLIHERLEAGDRITKHLKGPKRSRVIRSHQKLVKKAGSKIPDYGKDAQKVLETADRMEGRHLKYEGVLQVGQVLLDLISLLDAIEDYREAFPDSKDEKLLAIVGAGGDFYSAAAELAESFGKGTKFLRITGGAAGFISGVVDMLDAEEKGVRAAMNNNDYAAAAGHGITAVGASMTALAGGVLLVQGITGGAMFGGPFGAIVGAIGAGLMAVGMLVVAYFSDNDYQSFVRHCFLGEDHGTSVTPDWSTVQFGGGSLMNEVQALYDLLYRYKVNFVKIAKIIRQLPNDTTEWAGVKLIIHPQYGLGDESKYHVDLVMKHTSRYISGTFEEKNLVLPDAKSSTDGGNTPFIVRRWSGGQVVDNMLKHKPEPKAVKGVLKRLHIYTGSFTVTVQLMLGGTPVGKTTKLKGKIGGTNPKPLSSQWTQADYDEHHIVFE